MTTEPRASREQLKNLVFASIISADNYKYPEEVKQEILRRHFATYITSKEQISNWEYILEPLGEEAEKYLDILC